MMPSSDNCMPIWVYRNQHNSTTGSIPRSTQQRLSHRWVIERLKQQEPAPKTAPPSKKLLISLPGKSFYKQLNPRITTHVRAQKLSSLQDLLSIADEYVADSERGRESAWNSNMLYPQPTYQKSYKPFNGNKSQQQQPQPQIQSQINQPKSSPLFQQQGGARLPTNTPAQCGGSDGNQYKPQHKLAKYFDKDKGPLCFNCLKWGHLAAVCPDRNVFAVSTDNQDNTTLAPTFIPKLFLVGSIFGKPV